MGCFSMVSMFTQTVVCSDVQTVWSDWFRNTYFHPKDVVPTEVMPTVAVMMSPYRRGA